MRGTALIPFLIRTVGLNLLPALSLATHPTGPLSSFFALFYDKSPLIMAYNSLLWRLTLPQQLAWLDLVCTWVTPLTAAVNAVTFTVSVPGDAVQGLPFQPWALFWQALAMACVLTCLHVASLRAFHHRVQRQHSPLAAAQHCGSASTSTGYVGEDCWPVKRPAAVLEAGHAGPCSGCGHQEPRRLTGFEAAVQQCSQAASRRRTGEEAAPASTAAGKGSRHQGRQEQELQHPGEQVQEQAPRSSVLRYRGLAGPEVEEQGLEPCTAIADIGVPTSSTASGLGSSSADDAKWMEDPLAARPAALATGAGAGAAAPLPNGTPGSALDEALRLVRAQKLMSYSPVMECCQVHVRLEGMEPEQLQPGWQAGLAERLSEHGWCLLNVAVRRGSIYVSFTLVRAAQIDGDADNAIAQPAAEAAAADGDAVAAGQLAWGTAAAAAEGDMELGVMAGPEQLLLQMGLRREQLPYGFSMTVQAVTDDGRLQRLRYTLQPDGIWACESLDRVPGAHGEVVAADDEGVAVSEQGFASSSSTEWASAEGAGSSGEHAHQLLSDTEAERVPSVGAGWAAASLPYGCAPSSSGTACASAAGAVAEATEAPDASSDLRLLRAAQGLLRDTRAVDVHVAVRGDGAARARALGERVRESVHDVVLSAVPAVQRSARQPVRTTVLPPATQWALQMPGVLVGVSSIDADVCHLLYTAAVEVTRIKDPHIAQPSATKSGAIPPAAEVLGAAEELRFRARPLGRIGGMSELRVEQVAVQHQAGEPAGRAGAWSLAIWCEQAPESAAFRESGMAAADLAGAAAQPRPHLVDVSLWRGHDLLAARVVLLVPPECCGLPSRPPQPKQQPVPAAAAAAPGLSAAAAGRWVGELREVLQGQPAGGAQHLLVDMGLLLSGAFDEVAAGCASQQAAQGRAEPGQSVGTAAAASAAGPSPGQGPAAAGLEAVLSRRLRAAQQTLLVLDMGSGLLSLVLQCGAASLADYLWRTLQRMGFGPEEVLLHACGAGGDLPPLHAAVASGEPAAVDLVVGWYRTAKLPEPWLQPAAVSGAPAVLTPLVLACASSPPGALLWHTLCAHAGALAAWRVTVNGVSGRATAAAAGLWRVVLAVDAYYALSPYMARAGAWLPLRFSLSRGLVWSGQRASTPQTVRPRSAGAAAAAPGADANASAGRAAGTVAPPTTAATGPTVGGASGSSSATPTSKGFKSVPGSAAIAASPTADFDTYLAQRSRLGKLVLRWTVVAFQTVSQLRALTTGFSATCPAAASALDSLSAPGRTAASAAAAAAGSGLGALLVPYAVAGHALARCVAGRYWWTALEVLAVVWVSSPAALRKHDAACALITVLHACFQGLEGSLLPPSGMKAMGMQMVFASITFNLINSYANLPSMRLGLAMRLLEATAATHMYVRYGVTESLAVAVLIAAGVSAMGFATSACIRRRALAGWRRELRQQQQHPQQQPQQGLQQAGEAAEQPSPCRTEAGGATSAAGPSAVSAVGAIAATL
ncbi:hypothetical protein HXX76_005413 [Chlamydomonas incerta]|uniref:Uncharacterized protein n=1 Tax=Chlamydomonas incerta TaxID=51695 RepID=A0A835T7N7_CHLIN|nr:hypothetical protein HXX76_005413 [Chlamydomonas incerta]|eukprot:KAG2437793.1 hypothetical protein HXX76_005413 [Chlamydomonas incerta]